MKKLLIVAVAVTSALAFSSCAKDRIYGCTDPFSISYNPNATDDDGTCFVPSSQKVALMGDFTATWCPYCGEWGAPEFEKAIAGSGGAAIPLGIHNTDEITSEVAQALTDYYGADGTVSGYPTLLVWNQGSFYDGELMAAAALTEAATGPAEAGAVANFTDNGTAISISVSAETFSDVTGDYFVVAYLMEDGIVRPQKINGLPDNPNFVHNHVIRASTNGTPWGEQFVFAAGLGGTTFLKTYQVVKDPTWVIENMYMVAIVWKYDSATESYTYINAQETHF